MRRHTLGYLVGAVLVAVLPHRHGQPIGVYLFGTVSFLALMVYLLRSLIRGHRDITPVTVVWHCVYILAMPFLVYCYASSTLAAWRGPARAALAFPSFMIGMALLLVGIVGWAVAIQREKKRFQGPGYDI